MKLFLVLLAAAVVGLALPRAALAAMDDDDTSLQPKVVAGAAGAGSIGSVRAAASDFAEFVRLTWDSLEELPEDKLNADQLPEESIEALGQLLSASDSAEKSAQDVTKAMYGGGDDWQVRKERDDRIQRLVEADPIYMAAKDDEMLVVTAQGDGELLHVTVRKASDEEIARDEVIDHGMSVAGDVGVGKGDTGTTGAPRIPGPPGTGVHDNDGNAGADQDQQTPEHMKINHSPEDSDDKKKEHMGFLEMDELMSNLAVARLQCRLGEDLLKTTRAAAGAAAAVYEIKSTNWATIRAGILPGIARNRRQARLNQYFQEKVQESLTGKFSSWIAAPQVKGVVVPHGENSVTAFRGGFRVTELSGCAAIINSGDTTYVTVRGSISLGDWQRNFRFKMTRFAHDERSRRRYRVHHGFAQVYRGTEPILDMLASLQSSGEAHSKVVFTGHSLGGAIAQMLAVKWRNHHRKPKPSLVTFAAPRVGDGPMALLSKLSVDKFVRIVNKNDPVPYVPTGTSLANMAFNRLFCKTCGYRHPSTAHAIHLKSASQAVCLPAEAEKSLPPAVNLFHHRFEAQYMPSMSSLSNM